MLNCLSVIFLKESIFIQTNENNIHYCFCRKDKFYTLNQIINTPYYSNDNAIAWLKILIGCVMTYHTVFKSFWRYKQKQLYQLVCDVTKQYLIVSIYTEKESPIKKMNVLHNCIPLYCFEHYGMIELGPWTLSNSVKRTLNVHVPGFN